MIDFTEHILGNGLRVLFNRDRSSQMAAVNMLYEVGSADEEADHTGLAHLFEHLMFRGTRRIPDFDRCVEEVCGESNAFTTADYTDYYITLPKENFQTAMWLEADRMQGLNLSRGKFEAEKAVVVEEFNQRFLNQPYGDQWLLLRELVYTRHPYRWPVIGLTPDHIRQASLQEAAAFYKRHYVPSGAVLSVSADLDADTVFAAAEHWFGHLPSGTHAARQLAAEPPFRSARRVEKEDNVPADQITVAFVMESRRERGYYICDFLTDLLAGGESARLYLDLVKKQQLFSAVNAYITGETDRGMLVLTGQLAPDVTVERGEQALWEQLMRLADEPVSDYEMQKVKNKFEANITFGELNVMNKAMNLGYYSMLGDMALLNGEVDIYRSITAAEIADYIRLHLTPSQSATLIYRKKR